MPRVGSSSRIIKAKSEIYNIIYDLARQGIGVIVVSSELPEVLKIYNHLKTVTNSQNFRKFAGNHDHADTLARQIINDVVNLAFNSYINATRGFI